MWYKLDSDNNPIPCSGISEYEEWFMKHGTTVAQTRFLDTKGISIYVSTVFLGLDHSYNSTVPILWETMILGGPFDQQSFRYSSFKDALEGHNQIVDDIKSNTITNIEEHTITIKRKPINEKDLFNNVLKTIKDGTKI
jgi:hypothetical protein